MERHIRLTPGGYAINPPGVWHTVDTAGGAAGGATAMFITAGLGTEVRGRRSGPVFWPSDATGLCPGRKWCDN